MCPHKSAMVPWKSDENRRDWGFMYVFLSLSRMFSS